MFTLALRMRCRYLRIRVDEPVEVVLCPAGRLAAQRGEPFVVTQAQALDLRSRRLALQPHDSKRPDPPRERRAGTLPMQRAPGVIYAAWVLLLSEVVRREAPSHRECRARED